MGTGTARGDGVTGRLMDVVGTVGGGLTKVGGTGEGTGADGSGTDSGGADADAAGVVVRAGLAVPLVAEAVAVAGAGAGAGLLTGASFAAMPLASSSCMTHDPHDTQYIIFELGLRTSGTYPHHHHHSPTAITHSVEFPPVPRPESPQAGDTMQSGFGHTSLSKVQPCSSFCAISPLCLSLLLV